MGEVGGGGGGEREGRREVSEWKECTKKLKDNEARCRVGQDTRDFIAPSLPLQGDQALGGSSMVKVIQSVRP